MRCANRFRTGVASLAGVGVAALSSATHAADEAAGVSTHTYVFKALLDGKPIGEHRFDVVVDGQGRKVASEADFFVRFLGFQSSTTTIMPTKSGRATASSRCRPRPTTTASRPASTSSATATSTRSPRR